MIYLRRSKPGLIKRLIWILPFSLLSLTFAQPSDAKDIVIQFPKGSSCGSFAGKVNVGDSFVLNLAKEQQLIVRTSPHDYSVIAPNGRILEAIRQLPNNEKQYWTGNRSSLLALQAPPKFVWAIALNKFPDNRQTFSY